MFDRIFSKTYWNSILLLVQISIKNRNSNTILGSLWGLIQPFLHIAVISFFMSFLLRFESKIILKNLVGALPFWTFIIVGMSNASKSLKMNSAILKRVLLPKTYFPISETLSNCYTLAYSFLAMYICLVLIFPEFFTWKIIFIPLLALPLIISVTSGGIVAAYATPYLSDIPQLLEVLLGVVYWTIPIIYPYSMVPESKKIFFEMHPIYIVLKPMQDLVITGDLPSIVTIAKSWLVCLIVAFISYFIYKKLARNVIYYL
jgi:lipopolysaccharide transport system permease protein